MNSQVLNEIRNILIAILMLQSLREAQRYIAWFVTEVRHKRDRAAKEETKS